MRVLIAHYNPSAGGGAESAVRDQAAALEALGHEVAIEYVHPQRAYSRFRPDVVHYHTIHVGMGLDVLEWAQTAGIPHCLSLHDYWPFCDGRMLLAHDDQPCAAVTGLCDGRCDNEPAPAHVREIVNRSPVVTFNPYSAAIYQRHGVRVDAIIPHGIDTELFRPDYSQRDGVQIVTSSAWPTMATKGMHVLKAALKQIGAKAGLITGRPRERVADELRKASIFVFPSCYEETFGLCLTEAMASGCACIASDVCGARSQIDDGITGLLFPTRDAGALARAIQRLLDNGEYRDLLGHNARAKVERENTLEHMAREYEAFYGQLIAARE